MKDIIDGLVEKSDLNRSRAYQLFGSDPGPGIDIIFLPDLPVAHWYTIRCMSLAGAGFVQKLWAGDGRVSSASLTKMKRELAEFGLSFHTDWSQVVEIIP